MLYRIDFQHFMTHMIDYFTQDELLHCQYLILSAIVTNQKRIDNVSKIGILWPDNDSIVRYEETKNYDIFKKEYFDTLDSKITNETDVNWAGSSIYQTIIKLILDHEDVIIVCDRYENFIIDAFCEYLKKKWHAEAIDLNELFSKGKVGPIFIDRVKIRNSAVDIRRAATRDMIKSLEASSDGRIIRLRNMTRKEKKEKLRELGIKFYPGDNLDALLMDEWVNKEEDD